MHARFARTLMLAALAGAPWIAGAAPRYFDVGAGSGPHDVAPSPAPGGPVYYTGQRNGTLGILDPASGRVVEVKLGARSAPHGGIAGPDRAPWITDSGLNAIVRVDPDTRAVKVWPLPAEAANANLNTAAFDRKGRIWFTGQSGWYGRLDPATGDMKAWRAPRGYGPYGIATTPAGDVWYASLAGNHIARVDFESGVATPVDPPTPGQGARRIWSRFDGPPVGEVVEHRAGGQLRRGREDVARVDGAGRRTGGVVGVEDDRDAVCSWPISSARRTCCPPI